MWLAGEVGQSWSTRSWHSLLLVGGVILNVINGGRRTKPADPTRKLKLELQSVLQSLPEAVFLLDIHARIIDLNKAAEQLTGQTRDELLGMDAGAVSSRIVSTETNANPGPVVTRTLQGEIVRHENWIFCGGANGTPIDVRISGNPMYASKRRLGAMILIEDMTELSALQQKVASSETPLRRWPDDGRFGA